MKRLIYAASALVLLSSSLFAQNGCVHSPEAPTDVLLAVGSVGMFFGSSVVGKWIRRKR